MSAKTLSFSTLFSNSIADLKKLWKPFVIVGIATTILSFGNSFLIAGVQPSDAPITFEAGMRGVISFIVSVAIGYITYIFYMVVALEREKNIGKAFKKVWPLFFPMIGLTAWILIRTFTWLAVLGTLLFIPQDPVLMAIGIVLIIAGGVCGIIFGPRFYLAPFLLIKTKSSIRDSVQMSYDRTTGYWGKLVGNSLLLSLSMMAIVAVAVMIGLAVALPVGFMIGDNAGLLVIAIILGIAGAIFTFAVTQLLTGLTYIFSVHLAETVMANPLSGKTKTAKPAEQKASAKSWSARGRSKQ